MFSVTENCVPSESDREALTSNATVFGDKAYKEVVKVTWGHQRWNTYKSGRDTRAPLLSLPCKHTARRLVLETSHWKINGLAS